MKRRSAFSPVLTRYLLRQFLGYLAPLLVGFIMLYLIVDLFDRLDVLIENNASTGAAARYFLFKIPLMLTQVTPPAVILAILISFGMLARSNEITAFRACGVSLLQTGVPILAGAAVISVALLVWNETVVPFSSRRFQYVNNVEIRKRAIRGILSGREIWYHGQLGFYNIEHIDTDRESIRGLTVYRVDDQFHLDTVVEIPELVWQQGRWAAVPAVEYRLTGGPPQAIPLEPGKMSLPESFEDLLEFRREPEELSYLTLRNWINELLRKGIDASHLLVDLQMKLAVPFASFALALVGIPISARVRRHPSLAATFGLGMIVGFGYWVVLALGNSLGQSGVLSPIVAAWAANTFFALIGCALFLAGD